MLPISVMVVGIQLSGKYMRKFIIGDLHGCFELLQRALDHVKFDSSKDTLISVGDLIDRGPDSVSCLRLLNEPWFQTVLGNHEQLMLDFFDHGPTGRWWMPNGGNWWNQLNDETKQDVMGFLPTLRKLPVMLSTDTFHVIHAELMHEGPLTDNDLEDGEKFSQVTEFVGVDGECAIWGRSLWGYAYAREFTPEMIKGFKDVTPFSTYFNPQLKHIFSGHTTMRQPTRFRGQTNLDTGAFRTSASSFPDWAGLTICEPETRSFWLARPEGVKEVECLEID